MYNITMSVRKIALHESEKSPQMLMHQWTLNLMLEKDKKGLGRSEKLVCNRITVEQKLLCKRYRKKLQDSKIKFARITQNTQLEKDLIQERTFNTDVGNEIEKDEMLKKIWRAGSQKFLENRRKQEILKNRFLLRMGSSDSIDTTPPNPAPRSARPATRASMASPTFIKRPFTAIETHMRKYREGRRGTVDTDGYYDTGDGSASDSAEEQADDREKYTDSESAFKRLSRPRTAFANIQTTLASPRSTPVGQRSMSTVHKKTCNPTDVSPVGSIFQEVKKPTLLDLHRTKLREARYEEKIKEFGDSISGMCDVTRHVSDYYTLRLRKESEIQNAQKVVSFAHLATGGVPPEEFKRWSGNTALKAITVKSLDYDFDKRPSSYFHPSVY